MQSFSVCMAVYLGDNPCNFKAAVQSVYNQTVRPDEIIVVVDGPVSVETEQAIKELQQSIPILNVKWLDKNVGHAIARQVGLEAARNEWIAIMDSDDLSLKDRFEKQIRVIEEHPEVSVVGGLIQEFIQDIDQSIGTRIVPRLDEDIKRYLRSRCPINFVTVTMRKTHVQKLGRFMDWHCEEDYSLCARLALAGYKFYNLQENLVNVRVDSDTYQRRGGMRYFTSEARLQKYMLEHRIISYPRYVYNVAIRFILQVAMPNRLRGWVFKTLARK